MCSRKVNIDDKYGLRLRRKNCRLMTENGQVSLCHRKNNKVRIDSFLLINDQKIYKTPANICFRKEKTKRIDVRRLIDWLIDCQQESNNEHQEQLPEPPRRQIFCQQLFIPSSSSWPRRCGSVPVFNAIEFVWRKQQRELLNFLPNERVFYHGRPWGGLPGPCHQGWVRSGLPRKIHLNGREII